MKLLRKRGEGEEKKNKGKEGKRWKGVRRKKEGRQGRPAKHIRVEVWQVLPLTMPTSEGCISKAYPRFLPLQPSCPRSKIWACSCGNCDVHVTCYSLISFQARTLQVKSHHTEEHYRGGWDNDIFMSWWMAYCSSSLLLLH